MTFGGALTVTNLGSPLQAGDTFDLFDGTIGGTFASTNLFWDFSQFAGLGVIKVANSVRPPVSVIQPPLLSGTNLSLSVVSQVGYSYVARINAIAGLGHLDRHCDKCRWWDAVVCGPDYARFYGAIFSHQRPLISDNLSGLEWRGL